MLELVNGERTDRGLDPLVFDRNLNVSSETHSEWMQRTGTFSHTGQGGSSATERMRDASFELTGSWRTAENLAYGTEFGAAGYSDDVVRLHEGLMNSAGHRANILNPDLKSIGIGIEVGSSTLSNGRETVVITQNFATSAAANDPILTFEGAPETPDETGSAPVADTSSVTAPDLSGPWVERLDRLQTKAEKFQDRLDKWEAREAAGPRDPEKVADKIHAWEARIESLEAKVATWFERLQARWERSADASSDPSDDAVPAANASYFCDHVDDWEIAWSRPSDCDFA